MTTQVEAHRPRAPARPRDPPDGHDSDGHRHSHGHLGHGAPLLDIGGDIGALVLYADGAAAGPWRSRSDLVADPAHLAPPDHRGSSAGPLERPASFWAGVYAQLPEGDYHVWCDDSTRGLGPSPSPEGQCQRAGLALAGWSSGGGRSARRGGRVSAHGALPALAGSQPLPTGSARAGGCDAAGRLGHLPAATPHRGDRAPSRLSKEDAHDATATISGGQPPPAAAAIVLATWGRGHLHDPRPAAERSRGSRRRRRLECTAAAR